MGDPIRIVNFARTLINSHYLWGAAGNTPNASDGAFYRPSHVTLAPNSLEPHEPYVFAAQCVTLGTRYVCAGRYKHLTGGRATDSHEPALIQYLDQLRNTLGGEPMWCPFCNYFTPRVCQGDSKVDSRNKIIWGEDCRNMRHFDCIGFINYVISATCFKCQLDISAWLDRTFVKSIDPKAPPVAGDIILRGTDHIGFITEKNTVIQAEDHANGVHERDSYVPDSWSDRFGLILR